MQFESAVVYVDWFRLALSSESRHRLACYTPDP